MATRRGRGSTDRWEHREVTLPDGREVNYTVDTDPYEHIVAFFQTREEDAFRLLREADHPDAELPYGLRPEDQKYNGFFPRPTLDPGPFD